MEGKGGDRNTYAMIQDITQSLDIIPRYLTFRVLSL